MNNLEIDLTKNLGKFNEEVNIDITKKLVEENELIANYSSSKYVMYLNLLEKYMEEKRKKKYNSKYNYFVNDEGNFCKEAKEGEDDRDNQIIITPKYLNIELRIKDIDKNLNNLESKVRYLRSSLIDGKKSSAEEFDSLKKKIVRRNERKSIVKRSTKF